MKTIELRSISRQNTPATFQAFHLCQTSAAIIRWAKVDGCDVHCVSCEFGGSRDDHDQACRLFGITLDPVE